MPDEYARCGRCGATYVLPGNYCKYCIGVIKEIEEKKDGLGTRKEM
jgi:uncharacterized OB-fold protein